MRFLALAWYNHNATDIQLFLWFNVRVKNSDFFIPLLCLLATSYAVLLDATSIKSNIYTVQNLLSDECDIKFHFYNRTTRPTRFGTNGDSSSSVLLFALPLLCALLPSVPFRNDGLILRYLAWLALVVLPVVAEAKVYWRRKVLALPLPVHVLVRSCPPVVLGRASVTTTEEDRRRRERASLRTAADEKEHILVLWPVEDVFCL